MGKKLCTYKQTLREKVDALPYKSMATKIKEYRNMSDKKPYTENSVIYIAAITYIANIYSSYRHIEYTILFAWV